MPEPTVVDRPVPCCCCHWLIWRCCHRLLTGRLPDQAALYGILGKIDDLGLLLLAVSIAFGGDEAAQRT